MAYGMCMLSTTFAFTLLCDTQFSYTIVVNDICSIWNIYSKYIAYGIVCACWAQLFTFILVCDTQLKYTMVVIY